MLSENIQAKISKSVVNKVSCLTKVDEMHSRYDDNKVVDRREFLSEVGYKLRKSKSPSVLKHCATWLNNSY